MVDTGVTVVADAGERVQVHRQLQRRQSRGLPYVPGGDLVDGGSEVIVRALRVLGEGRTEEARVRCVMGARIGVL